MKEQKKELAKAQRESLILEKKIKERNEEEQKKVRVVGWMD